MGAMLLAECGKEALSMKQLSPVEIARLEERRQAVGTAEVAVVSEDVGGGIMSYSGPASWSNQACGMGLDGPVDGAELDRLVEFYRSRDAQPRIEVCPFVDETLIEGLAARGFVIKEFENVLARLIDPEEDLWASLPRELAGGLEIADVDRDDDRAVEQFIRVSSSGFVPEGEEFSEASIAVANRVVQHARSDSFLATIEGEAAGGGGMESAPPVACLFGTSVLPRFRKRGIQAALIVKRVERARLKGCELAVIHSKPGIPTERNAARVGFFMAYTKVVMVQGA